MTTPNQALRQERRYVRKAAIVIASVFVSVVCHSTPLLATNPVPFIDQPLVPDAAVPGGKAFTLTVNGTGFVAGSTVAWNGSPRATTFVSGSQLTAAINAADIAVAATVSVTVVNPAPGGGASNPMFFSVTSNTPAISLAGTDYLTGSRSQAVAAADLNGDGKLDLVVGNLDSATVSVFLGDGSGRFNAHADFATGLYPNSLVVADFNGDGKPDLALANGSGTVSILLGNGDGTFQPHVEYTTGPGAFSLAVGDFNADGKLDLAVANNNSNQSGTVSILLGNGDGSFQTHVDYAVGMGPYSVAVGDFNRDGKLDLVVANYPSVFTVSVLLGNGDGTFQSQVTYPVGRQPISVAVADLNGDGKLDLAVADFTDGFVSVLLGNGDGTFQPSVEYPTGRVPSTIIIGDFNGDGKLDIATSNFAPGGYTVPPGYINILFGNGDGTLQPPVAFVAGPNPDTVVVADLNNDGALDFVTGSGSVPGAATFSVLLQVPQVRVLRATSTALMSSGSPATFGQQVTFTVTVSPQTGSGTPTGTVAFLDGSTQIGSGTLNAQAQAMFSSSSLSAGTHLITAKYSSDANFAASTSQAVSQTVQQAASSTVVVSSANPGTFGQSVTFTATVSSSTTGTPTGPVQFFDGSTQIGAGPLGANAQAMFSTASLAVGTHSITAKYSGDTNFLGSTSTAVSETVLMATSTALTSSANPITTGQQVTFTAAVSKAAGSTGTPTGTVTFRDGATLLGTGTLNASGVAAFVTSSLAVGSHSITAAYGGDSNFAPSASTVLTETVNAPLDFSIAAAPGGSTSATVKAGQTAMYSLRLSLVGGVPTDQITVTVTCAQAPPKAVCSGPAPPMTVTQMAPVVLAISVNTTANGSVIPLGPSPRLQLPANPVQILWPLALLLALSSMFVRNNGGTLRLRGPLASRSFAAAVLLFALAATAITGCNGGSMSSPPPVANGTPAGAYTLVVTVTATQPVGAGTLSHTQQLALTVQ